MDEMKDYEKELQNLKISNTLLSGILKRPVEIVDIDEYKCMIRNSTYFDNKQRGIVYRYLYGNKEIRFMSIYELAFKCQESATVKGFDICPKMDSKGFYRLLTDDNIIGFKIEDKFIFSESISPCSSRVEAIFKAYEWILNQEIKND